METKNESPLVDVIEAAGGLLWRGDPSSQELLLIHRPRYDDWTLPKGKREPGERWQETATREIYEEAGYKVELIRFAGSTAYTVKGVAKVVLFWHMFVIEENQFSPNDEVDHLLWLPIEDAINKLSYDTEKRLLKEHTNS